eukprot:Platyproteum_vivax@DN13047_c0_g1_i1.p1
MAVKTAGSVRECLSFDERNAEAHRIRAKYPNRIPVICEKAANSDLPDIEKRKFLVPMNMVVGEFKYIIQKHINTQTTSQPNTQNEQQASDRTIYLFVGNTTPASSAVMQEVYQRYKDEDGFLYFTYSAEDTLG